MHARPAPQSASVKQWMAATFVSVAEPPGVFIAEPPVLLPLPLPRPAFDLASPHALAAHSSSMPSATVRGLAHANFQAVMKTDPPSWAPGRSRIRNFISKAA
jgi:hypothetical protein